MSAKALYPVFLGLIRCGLGISYDLPHIDDDLAKKIISLASKHSVLPLVGEALLKHISPHSSLALELKHQLLLLIAHHEQMMAMQRAVFNLFEQKKIAYLPLKGAELDCYYPNSWMRTRSDVDVLIHSEQVEEALSVLKEHLHFTVEERNYHDVSLRSQDGKLLELHFNLLERQTNLDQVLSLVWQYVSPVGESVSRQKMDPAYFVFHQIAHTAYHFQNGGCGVRFLIDLYLVRQNLAFDEMKLRDFCREADLLIFYHNLCRLMDCWFSDLPAQGIIGEMSEFILAGGVFGKLENKLMNERARRDGRIGFIFSRIFWPYRDLAVQYPSLEGKIWLTPLYQVRRWCRLLRFKKLKSSVQQLKLNQNLSEKQVTKLAKLMRDVGL